MESICDYLKQSVPESVSRGETMVEIFHLAYDYGDIKTKLQTFETEYQVMHELHASFHRGSQTVSDLESMNDLLRKQNKDLIEQLAVCRGAIVTLECTVGSLQKAVEEQQRRLDR